jgi:NTP pyrophosphatase (non-canonical NTP hydrolase)
MSLQDKRKRVQNMIDQKKLSRRISDSGLPAFIEVGEFFQACIKRQSGQINKDTKKPYTANDLADEFADAVICLIKAANIEIPEVDLDKAFNAKLEGNFLRKIKDFDETGRVVLK